MDWMNALSKIFELVVIPVLTVLGIYLARLISVKLGELKEKSDNDKHDKYISMLDKTITECVLATTQTYVESLKKQGKFDLEAQKVALKMTYDNVLGILTEDAKEYLSEVIKDLNTYITTKIESEVAVSKQRPAQ